MAFLCPARIKKEWKKRVQANSRPQDKPAAPGRITGSASMDTLVRVNLEKNNGGRKMIMMVLYDFTPCTDDELGVKRGDRVRVLYRELEWAYAIRDDGEEGFMPFSYLASPAKLSRRAVPGDDRCDCDRCAQKPEHGCGITNKMSSLTLASTKAVQFSTKDSSDSGDDLSHNTRSCSTSDSDSTASNRMEHIRIKPAPDNVARLGAYVGSTTQLNREVRKRSVRPKFVVEEATSPANGTTSGVYSESDSPGQRTDASPQPDASPATQRTVEPRRITFKAAGDSDSGCENTNSPKTSRSTTDVKTYTKQEAQLSTSFEAFDKRPLGNYLVMFSFDANQENDLSVRPGEFLTVLNKDDPDWYWVKTRDDDEGFVPSNYLCDVKGPELDQHQDSYYADESAITEDSFFTVPSHFMTSTPARPTMNRRCSPKKMLILRDYEARQTDDISVKQGQYVYADMDNQRFLDWIWVYSQVKQQEGFIPREYAKPPNGTIVSTEL